MSGLDRARGVGCGGGVGKKEVGGVLIPLPLHTSTTSTCILYHTVPCSVPF